MLGFYRERGFLGSALVNYCALLGWTPNSSDAGGASRHLNQEGQSSHHHSDIFFNMQALIDKVPTNVFLYWWRRPFLP